MTELKENTLFYNANYCIIACSVVFFVRGDVGVIVYTALLALFLFGYLIFDSVFANRSRIMRKMNSAINQDRYESILRNYEIVYAVCSLFVMVFCFCIGFLGGRESEWHEETCERMYVLLLYYFLVSNLMLFFLPILSVRRDAMSRLRTPILKRTKKGAN